MEGKKERRRFPRIQDKDISVKLSGDGVDTSTQSLDVSASGIYCKVDKRLPVMTMVEVILSLPGKTKSDKPVEMTIDGVVVRENAVKENGEVKYPLRTLRYTDSVLNFFANIDLMGKYPKFNDTFQKVPPMKLPSFTITGSQKE